MSVAFQALTLNTTGQVLTFGYQDVTLNGNYNAGTMTVHIMTTGLNPPVKQEHTKVVANVFTEMTAGEKTTSDAAELVIAIAKALIVSTALGLAILAVINANVHFLATNSLAGFAAFAPLHEENEVDALTSTGAAGFVNALTLTTSSLPAGDYVISWYYEAGQTTALSVNRSRIILDSTTDLSFTNVQIGTNTGAVVPISGSTRRTLTAAVHTIEIEFFPLTGATAEVSRRRIRIERVS